MEYDNSLHIKTELTEPDIARLSKICNCKCARYFDDNGNMTDYYVTVNGDVYKFNENEQEFIKLTKRYFSNGYQYVNLILYTDNDGTFKKAGLVHRLVAKTFIPNPDNKPQVNHIDGNKSNNTVNNLEWVTAKENIEHAFNTGLRGYGEHASKVTMTDDIVTKICELIVSNKYTLNEIANRVHQPYYLVFQVYKKQSWPYITEKYDFSNFNKFGPTYLLSKLTVDRICQYIAYDMYDDATLASMFKVTPSTIQGIRCKRYHKDISDKYF